MAKEAKIGNYHVIDLGDIEYVDPFEHFMSMSMEHNLLFHKHILELEGKDIKSLETNKRLFVNAAKETWDFTQEILSTKIPLKLLGLLNSKSKKEQIKQLKGLSLTTMELTAFICYAGHQYGFSFSQYRSEHYPKGTMEESLPSLAYLEENGEVDIVGDTELSNGQIKQLIKQRSVIVSKFLDKGEEWHCFFLTFKSLSGREQYKNGQPHLHYISNKWGIKRKDVLLQLRNKDYQLPALPHIDYHTHRNPKG